ncbi:MAG: hypothetical protein PHT99_06075 [Methanoregula sp.]|nr:hypothetical protein [Methanoregula sp.]
MSGENSPPKPQQAGHTILFLELAVPVCSFGGALLALFFSGPGSTIDARFFAAGCVLGSFALAYLAWIRPRKDIVALTTPIYAILFFMVPSDFSVNMVLELLYAVSLTILLVRMKLRFGAAPESGVADGKVLEEPLKTYCETVRGQATGLSPEAAHFAAAGFARFAQGEYREAVAVADAAMSGLEPAAWPLATAFAIVREQALLLDASVAQPEQFIEFVATEAGYLAKPLPPDDNLHDRFEVSLDNALLLLYAAAWNGSAKDRPLLLVGQGFALKLYAS